MFDIKCEMCFFVHYNHIYCCNHGDKGPVPLRIYLAANHDHLTNQTVTLP